MAVKLKRVYEAPARSDGFRILIDRLWPRGLSKKEARVDLWLKSVAPSTELRRWFNHDADRWREFVKRYRAELRENKQGVGELREAIADRTSVTLVYGARDTEHNDAVALKQILRLCDAGPDRV
jgi:uncharacterized protein YeaO (DUF488 family)